MQAKSSCVFCRIVTNDDHGQIEWQTEDSIVIAPRGGGVTEGHRLIIPRIHVDNALKDAAVSAATMRDAVIYANSVQMEGCNFITSVGPLATQTIFHLHLHLVPRRLNDNLLLPWTSRPQP